MEFSSLSIEEEPTVVRSGGVVGPTVLRCVLQGLSGTEVTFEHRPLKVQLRDCKDSTVYFRGGVASVECLRCNRVRVVVVDSAHATATATATLDGRQPAATLGQPTLTLDGCTMCVLKVPTGFSVSSTATMGCVLETDEEQHQVPSSGLSVFRDGWRSSESHEEAVNPAPCPVQELARRLGRVTTARLISNPRTPCEILPDLFLSDARGVADAHHLKRLGVTHVLNVASGETPNRAVDYAGQGITLFGIEADDSSAYDMMQHLDEAAACYKAAGKLVVHCVAGVNRSGVLATALFMLKTDSTLLDAARKVNLCRGQYLTNKSFQRQISQWALLQRSKGSSSNGEATTSEPNNIAESSVPARDTTTTTGAASAKEHAENDVGSPRGRS